MSQHYHIEQEVEKALPVLQKGGTILYPTDTIWGIGCDATQEDAVKKIYRIKQRQDSKSLITLVDSIDMLRDYLTLLPPGTEALMAQAKRPLTIIYPDAKGLAPNVISPDGSAAIRVVRHPLCQALVRAPRRQYF